MGTFQFGEISRRRGSREFRRKRIPDGMSDVVQNLG